MGFHGESGLPRSLATKVRKLLGEPEPATPAALPVSGAEGHPVVALFAALRTADHSVQEAAIEREIERMGADDAAVAEMAGIAITRR